MSLISSKEHEICSVVYDPDVQEDWLRKLIEHACLVFRKNVLTDDDRGIFWLLVAFDLSTWLSRFKHPAFSEEREWRMRVMHSGTPAHFRVVGNRVVPYVAWSFHSSIVPKIVQGPTVNPIGGLRGLRRMLDEYGFCNVEIVSSHIPLRV